MTYLSAGFEQSEMYACMMTDATEMPGEYGQRRRDNTNEKTIDVPPTNPSITGPRANQMYVPGSFSQKWAVAKNTKSDSMRPPTLKASTLIRP